MTILPVLILLAPASALAEPKVIFFGGATSSKAVLDRCFPSFENYGYPPGAKQLAGVIDEINADPNQAFVIVGHSSGTASANQVARGLKSRKSSKQITNPSRITLIDLDGGGPVGVPESIRRVCWNAEGGKGGKVKSKNFSAMTKANKCSEVHTYSDHHCSSSWCMHFSLVNPHAASDLRGGFCRGRWVKAGKKSRCQGKYVPGTWAGAQGYAGCAQGDLPWLRR